MVDYINAIKYVEKSLEIKYGKENEALISIIDIKSDNVWYKYSINNLKDSIRVEGLIDKNDNIIELENDEVLKYNISTYSKYYNLRNYYVQRDFIYLVKEGDWDYINDIKKVVIEKKSLINGDIISSYDLEVEKDGQAFHVEYFLKNNRVILELDNKVQVYKIYNQTIIKEISLYKKNEDIISIDKEGQIWVANKDKLYKLINKELKEYCTVDFEFENLIISERDIFVWREGKYININKYIKYNTVSKKEKKQKSLILSFNISKGKKANINDNLELVAKGSSKNLLFDFFVKNLKDDNWIRISKMTSKSYITWSPNDKGVYIVRCRAKEEDSKNRFDSYKDIKIEIT